MADGWTILQFTYWLVLISTMMVVYQIGGHSERIGVSIIGCGSLLSTVFASSEIARFQDIEVGIAMIDMAVLAGFLRFSFQSTRFGDYGRPVFNSQT